MQAMLQRWKPSAAPPSGMIQIKEIVEHIQEDEVQAFEVMLRQMYKPELAARAACSGQLLLKVFSLSDRWVREPGKGLASSHSSIHIFTYYTFAAPFPHSSSQVRPPACGDGTSCHRLVIAG